MCIYLRSERVDSKLLALKVSRAGSGPSEALIAHSFSWLVTERPLILFGDGWLLTEPALIWFGDGAHVMYSTVPEGMYNGEIAAVYKFLEFTTYTAK